MNHELLDDYMADMLAGPAPTAPSPSPPSPVSLVPSSPAPELPPAPAAVEPPTDESAAVEPAATEPVDACLSGPSAAIETEASDVHEPEDSHPAIDMVAELMAEFDAEIGGAKAPPAPPAPLPSLMDDLLAEFDAEVGNVPAAAPASAGPPSLLDDLLAEFDAEVGNPPGEAPAVPEAPSIPPPSLPTPSAQQAVTNTVVPPALASALERADPEKRRRAEDVVKRWLRFNIGDQSYAVEVLKVQEVMRVPEVLPLRGADPSVLGVMNLRGLIVPVVDMGMRLMCPPVDVSPLSRVIVLESDGEALGILVSSVAEVMGISEAHVEHPGNLQCGSSCDSLTGVCRQHGQLTVLLDAMRLLD